MSAPEIVLVGELAAIAALYLAGVARLPRRARRPVRAVAFCAGLAMLAVALVPLDRAASDSLGAHMTQHLLLLFAAAPLLLAGAPHRVALGALPILRSPASRLLRSRAARALAHPFGALTVFAVAVIVWHLPGAYDAAVAAEPLHALEHAAFLGAGILLWMPLLAAPPRPHGLSPLLVFLYLMAAMVPGALVGLWLISAGTPVYEHYSGISVEAQRSAGMLMVGAGGLVLAAAAVAIGWAGIEREERRQRARQARSALMVLCAAGAITLAVGSSERSAAQESEAPAAGGAAGVGEVDPEVARGRQLFEEGCSDCHGLDARGIEGRGPTLYGAGEAAADFYLRTGRMPLANPDKQPERSEPSFSDEQIDALVAYIGSLGEGPVVPVVDAESGEIAEGQRLFTELCAGCHQVVAQGGIVTRGVVPDLQQAEPIDVAEAIEVGPYLMPSFERLDRGQVNSLARYVTYTRDPEDRGGWGIGHIGPIPEGMVAWLLAGAALLLAIRLIGERTTR